MKLSRRTLLCGAATALMLSRPAAALLHGTSTKQTYWSTLPVGAGGFIRGLDIASDGSILCRTDVGGFYLLNKSTNIWTQLITSLTMPAGFVSPPQSSQINFLGGVWDARFCAGNSQYIYFINAQGYLFKSINKGVSFTQTALAKITGTNFDANGTYSSYKQKLAVDPANPNIVVTSTTAGIEVSLDAGATWNLNGTVPAQSVNWSGGLIFDPSNGTVVNGGQTQTANVFLTSSGHGVWFSSTGISGTFTQISDGAGLGGPTNIRTAQVDSTGVYFCADGTKTWMCKNAATSPTWTELKVGGNSYSPSCVCTDPATPGNLVVSGPSGGTFLDKFTNYGAGTTYSWFSNAANHSVLQDTGTNSPPWMAWSTGNYPSTFMTVGDMIVDPTTGLTWFAEGIGMWYGTIPNSQNNFTWYSLSAGIEELVANDVIAAAGGYPVVASWDRAAFTLTDLSHYPSTYGPTGQAYNESYLTFGAGLDYASDNPDHVVVRSYYTSGAPNDTSAYSLDKGQTWNIFAGLSGISPNNFGGCIAAATADNVVMILGNNGGAWYSKNATSPSATWAACPSPCPTSDYIFAYYLCSHIVAADRVANGGGFYNFYVVKQTGTAGTSGVWASGDGGDTWVQIYSGNISTFGGDNMRLRSVPGNAGHLFYCDGAVQGSGVPVNTFLKFATNGQAAVSSGGSTSLNWTSVSRANGFNADVKEVFDFGFGKSVNGGYPAIYLAGWVDKTGSNPVWGIWRCDGFNPASPGAETWTSLAQYANNNLDQIKVINGDMSIYGRVYAGFTGTGFAYGDLR